jgi:predicted permease
MMVHMLAILEVVLPVFLLIGLGFLLRKARLFDQQLLLGLNRLIFYIALPALMFYKIALADFSASFNATLLWVMVLVTLLAFSGSYLLAIAIKLPIGSRGAFCQGTFRGNLAYIGLAMVYNAYGETGFAMAGVLLGFLVPVYNLLAVLALLLPQKEKQQALGRAFWMYQFAFNPLILSSFAGILWSYFNLGLPLVVDRTLEILTGMSLPLALLAIGASFSMAKLRGELLMTWVAVSIKILWLPLLTATILLVMRVRGVELAVGVLLAGTPTATAAYIMAQQLDGDAELSGAIIMLSTVLSILTYSLSLFLLKLLPL